MLIRISLYAIYQTICRILRWQDSIVSHKITAERTLSAFAYTIPSIDRWIFCIPARPQNNVTIGSAVVGTTPSEVIWISHLGGSSVDSHQPRRQGADHGLRLRLAGVQRAIKWEYVDKVKSTFAGHRWDTEIVSHAFQHISTTTQPRGLNNIHRTCPTYRILLVQYFY